MANNHVHEGKVIDYKNDAAGPILSGSVVVMGDMIGVALFDIQPGKVGSVQIEEAWKLPKKNTDALSIGDSVFWHVADKQIVKASGAGVVPAGRVVADAAASAATVAVKLNI